MAPKSPNFYCGAEKTTKLIANIETVGSGIGILFTVLFILVVYSRTGTCSPVFLIVLSVFVGHFLMGFLLLEGIKQRQPRYLVAWKYCAAIGLIIYAILRLYHLDSHSVNGTIVRICFSMALGIFCIAVVDTFKFQVTAEAAGQGPPEIVVT